MEWKLNEICEQRQFSLMGQNFSWIEQIGHRFDQQRIRRERAGNIWAKTEVFAFCKPIKGYSKTEKTFHYFAHLQEFCLFLKEFEMALDQELNPIRRTQWQEDWTLFFGMDNYFEKEMGRSDCGDWKRIFGTNLSTLNIGLTICGRARWQEAETTRKDSNIVLTRQDKKFFNSELFKVIQDAIPLILHFRTMC